MPTDRQFTNQYSAENLMRQATQSPALLQLPPEYAQGKPNTLAMDTDALLSTMAQGTHSPHGNPGVPYADPSYPQSSVVPFRPNPNAPTPPISVQQLTDLMRKNESSGNYTALNRQDPGNTASGAYQYTDSTWNGYGGYAKAMLAPKEVQDRKFAEDMHARYLKFGGDPFRVIAAHYLPIAANKPTEWGNRFYIDAKGRKKNLHLSVAEYIDRTLHGTQLQPAFQTYLKAHQGGV